MVGLTPHMCATGWLERTHQGERSTFVDMKVQQQINLLSQAVLVSERLKMCALRSAKLLALCLWACKRKRKKL